MAEIRATRGLSVSGLQRQLQVVLEDPTTTRWCPLGLTGEYRITSLQHQEAGLTACIIIDGGMTAATR